MKKLLAVIILIFTLHTPSQADDIRDFQIEGMSIGDSLLDYFSKQEIINEKKNWFNDNEYSLAADLKSSSFETYKSVQASYKTEDKKFIITGLEGYIYFENLEDCYETQDKVIAEVSKILKNAKKGKKKTFDHQSKKSKSFITNVTFMYDSGDFVMVACVDRKDQKWDNVTVVLRSKEYSYFLKNKAYK